MTLHNTIVAENTINSGATISDVQGAVSSSSSYNLFSQTTVSGATAGNHNQLGITSPGLLPLDDNGGPTETHALASTSPALDQGSDAMAAGLTTDQRGFGRDTDLSVADGIGGQGDCTKIG